MAILNVFLRYVNGYSFEYILAFECTDLAGAILSLTRLVHERAGDLIRDMIDVCRCVARRSAPWREMPLIATKIT